MLRGIDVSNWQKGLDVSALDSVGFVIAKATEGTGFVDPVCDPFVQQARGAGKCWGFYHFAGSGSPENEASFFVANTRNYFGEGVPVLDWETDQTVDWVNRFVRTVHGETGVWPWIYANPWRFAQGAVEPNCGRWVASYPDWYRPAIDRDLPDPPEADGLVCAWQFASDGLVPGAEGWNLDVDVFYGDERAWAAYAAGDDAAVPSEPPEQDVPAAGVAVLENGEYRVTVERL